MRFPIAWTVTIFFGLTAHAHFLAAQPFVFTEQGPGPIVNGQDEGLTNPTNPVAGAVNAVAIQPGSSDVIYVATVNGGIWKTTNATAASPTWTPLTDLQLPALSINSIAISPVDNNTIYAGSGSTSSDGFDGSAGFGVLKSIDGGATWSITGLPLMANRRIVDVVPTALGSPAGSVVMAASFFGAGGVYRTADGGATWTRISGLAGSGLPNTGVSSLVADPTNANRFYVSIARAETSVVANLGIWVSNDGGLTWAQTLTVFPAAGNSYRIPLSVNASTGVLWAMVIDRTTFDITGIFYSPNQGATWLGGQVPSPSMFPGGQGSLHGAIAASPTDPTVVYISGDRQNNPFPNANGCSNFSGNIFRGVQSAGVVAFTNVVCSGANRTSPHADSRRMVFDSNGNVLNANDGGLFRLTNPDSAARVWSSVLGSSGSTLRPTEFVSVTYDPLTNVVMGGAQDVGSSYQLTPGSFTWNTLEQGDGAYTAVDADQTAHPGTSIRYFCYVFMQGCFRRSYNTSNAGVGAFISLGLNIIAGAGSGQKLLNYDPNLQFYNPYVLNRLNGQRMLIGSTNIYESMNQGDSLTDLLNTGAVISSLSYGSMLNGVAQSDAFYVAAGTKLWHRVTLGGPITSIPSPSGQSIRWVVMDPQNYQRVYLVDSTSHVWGSTDEGATWSDLTLNLPSLCTDVRTVEIYSPDPGIRNTRLLVGGMGGVFVIHRPGAAGFAWGPAGSNLPHGLALTVKYDYANNVLLAGYLGRGAWTVTNPFGGSSVLPAPSFIGEPEPSPLPALVPVATPASPDN
jgi:hypothetical protein